VGSAAVERPIENGYRSIISDNLRWIGFTPRPGDIFVCTPPKCGTTWMQTIVASLLFPDGDAPGPVVEIAPWIDARFDPHDEIIARLDAQTFRRSIKTHTVADGIPWYPTASYIVVGRDGRDAFMSFLNHMRNLRFDTMGDLLTSAIAEGIDLGTGGPPPVDDVHEFFAWWMDEGPAWFGHVSSFWEHRDEPNVLFVHYNDMQADLDGQMRRVAGFLDIEVAPALWPSVVERCTFASMKARPAEIGDFDRHFVGGADTFLYKASNGRWRDVLTADELAAFERRSRETLAPDAIAWTESGMSALVLDA
jgi:aryl sulfotransferase